MIRVNSVPKHVLRSYLITNYVILNAHTAHAISGTTDGVRKGRILKSVLPNVRVMKILLEVVAKLNVVVVPFAQPHVRQTAMQR